MTHVCAQCGAGCDDDTETGGATAAPDAEARGKPYVIDFPAGVSQPVGGWCCDAMLTSPPLALLRFERLKDFLFLPPPHLAQECQWDKMPFQSSKVNLLTRRVIVHTIRRCCHPRRIYFGRGHVVGQF
jgi:hypothetical protein